jgi:hypothetical protein
VWFPTEASAATAGSSDEDEARESSRLMLDIASFSLDATAASTFACVQSSCAFALGCEDGTVVSSLWLVASAGGPHSPPNATTTRTIARGELGGELGGSQSSLPSPSMRGRAGLGSGTEGRDWRVATGCAGAQHAAVVGEWWARCEACTTRVAAQGG